MYYSILYIHTYAYTHTHIYICLYFSIKFFNLIFGLSLLTGLELHLAYFVHSCNPSTLNNGCFRTHSGPPIIICCIYKSTLKSILRFESV